MKLLLPLLLAFVGCGMSSASAACLEISEDQQLEVTGDLSRPIFAGPPNYTDVRQGDAPEPAYILKLHTPICVTGDEFLGDNANVDRIHLIDDGKVLRQWLGKSVSIVGKNMFGGHTGHHHAPLLMTVVTAAAPSNPVDPSVAMTTVEAFYYALEIGDGASAAMNIVPEKRGKGPLSAKALSAFYGTLKRPLALLNVAQLAPNQFRARYTFESHNGKVCDGSSVVTTRQEGDLNLIDRIRAENGC
ncbi:hypothetical protein M2281_003740 [Mesorhizobium soli]|uniref:DUF4431 domain-containing protein n=1 Tax=Pseudaminobacter soli (ex Li et al. 2025) TaxID=1295366 RepID=UPI002473F78A|nr:DUF4431 domain-containing protein [Mesorhizobium soli]MDH6233129.1 hypothetical protein [Mesorhizobium soli]